MLRRMKPDDFNGKTIVSTEHDTDNVLIFTFSDETWIEIVADVVGYYRLPVMGVWEEDNGPENAS